MANKSTTWMVTGVLGVAGVVAGALASNSTEPTQDPGGAIVVTDSGAGGNNSGTPGKDENGTDEPTGDDAPGDQKQDGRGDDGGNSATDSAQHTSPPPRTGDSDDVDSDDGGPVTVSMASPDSPDSPEDDDDDDDEDEAEED